MGEVIRANVDVDDIFKDAGTALVKATARGGTIQERAEAGVAPVLAMVDALDAEMKTAVVTLAPLAAKVDAANAEADAAINRTYDDVWNDVGRPGNDRFLALMFPGGSGYYTEGDTPGQPARMELLAKLFDRALHPKLGKDQSHEYAARVRDAAVPLKEALDAAAGPSANLALLKRVRTALGRVAQFELANLKRMYKIDGMTEAEIHTIIPDRPAPKKPTK